MNGGWLNREDVVLTCPALAVNRLNNLFRPWNCRVRTTDNTRFGSELDILDKFEFDVNIHRGRTVSLCIIH